MIMSSDELIALAKKQPIGVACGVICVICAGLIYFRSGKIEENQAAYEAKSAEAATIVTNVLNSAKLPEQVAELQGLSKEMVGRLIRAGQLAGNLQYFYKLEAETEVKLLDVRQGDMPKSAKSYTGIPFNVAVQGSFKQVLSFLQKLETGPHFCHFKSANFLKAAGASTDSSSISLSLNLEFLGTP